MTVPSNQANRYSYAGNGASTVFAFNSVFENAADIVVYLWDTVNLIATLQVLNTNYTLTGGSGSTGSVTFLSAPASTLDVVLVGVPAVAQSLVVVPDGAFPAETFEYGIDYLTLLVRRCEDLAARSVAIPDWDVSGFSPVMPYPRTAGDLLCVNAGNTGLGGFPTVAQRANQVLGFDATGLPIAVSGAGGGVSVVPTALGTLNVQATVANITFANSPFTALPYHRVINVNTAGGNVIVNLPAASGVAGTQIEVVKTTSDANTVTVTPNGTDNFLGANVSQVISNQWTSLRCLLLGALGWIN